MDVEKLRIEQNKGGKESKDGYMEQVVRER